MRKFVPLFIGFCYLLLASQLTYATVPNTDNPTTFLGPFGRLGFTTTLTDYTAISVAGEGAPRNFRVGGTWGWSDFGNNRFKVSAEYLWQKINYGFFSGNSYQWVQQGAVGADYQYLFEEYELHPQLDLNAYLSHAPSKNLNSVSGTYVNNSGSSVPFTDSRHIAGANAYGVNPGVNLQPWDGGNFGINLNYDNVRYETIYIRTVKARGLGGTARLNQVITDNVELGLVAAVRKPFNNYQANLGFTAPTHYGTFIIGINGAYTIGKKTLPSTYNVGLSADYLLDRTELISRTQRQATQSFLSWVAKPAVYMPQVLAIAEDNVPSCASPTFIGQIGNGGGGGLNPSFVTPLDPESIASNFTGENLVYSVDLNGNPNAGGFTVNSNGVISDPDADTIENLSITATNACGSATSNLFNLRIGG